MEIRPATRDDGAAIEDVARGSLQTSYSLSPMENESIIEAFFSPESVEERLDGEGLLFVAVDDADGDEEVVGFAEVDADDTFRWLHVELDARGRGVGTALFERVRDELNERGAPVTARILEAADEGRGFLEQFGLTRSGTAHLEFDGERFAEHVYAESEDPEANEPSVEVPETVSVDGRELTLDRDDEIPGTDAPFFALYESESDDSRWGFFCAECGGTDVSADGLDRLECGNCGNAHLADRWDSAYL